LQELEETQYWLELLQGCSLISKEESTVLREECDELIAIFVSMVQKTKSKQR
jgi:four helix bundle protein